MEARDGIGREESKPVVNSGRRRSSSFADHDRKFTEHSVCCVRSSCRHRGSHAHRIDWFWFTLDTTALSICIACRWRMDEAQLDKLPLANEDGTRTRALMAKPYPLN
ncbi:hypothetical protein NL676_020674 [Syzygium grande]|nr:hypothetical protein NL676_020674 [Syzygium grande]